MMLKNILINLGWNMADTPEENIWEENGHIFFSVGDPDDITGYTVEVDPEGMSRHIGNGEGCFWTEWE